MTKTLLTILAAFATIASAGCGSENDQPAKANSTMPNTVLTKFRAARLEVGSASTMTPADYGLAPKVGKRGVRFLIPSLGADSGGRIVTFSNSKDMQALRDYYDKLGRASAAFFSWTFVNEDRLVLLQINGEMPKAEAAKYGRVIAAL